ncbi:hypothetical protein DFJ74DRAFT_673688 [Hyaloraphidium curvatum]|nr:hypothetical protein DFJ74DRAFT_673688 [Hyaloraphidium curvatum]
MPRDVPDEREPVVRFRGPWPKEGIVLARGREQRLREAPHAADGERVVADKHAVALHELAHPLLVRITERGVEVRHVVRAELQVPLAVDRVAVGDEDLQQVGPVRHVQQVVGGALHLVARDDLDPARVRVGGEVLGQRHEQKDPRDFRVHDGAGGLLESQKCGGPPVHAGEVRLGRRRRRRPVFLAVPGYRMRVESHGPEKGVRHGHRIALRGPVPGKDASGRAADPRCAHDGVQRDAEEVARRAR